MQEAVSTVWLLVAFAATAGAEVAFLGAGLEAIFVSEPLASDALQVLAADLTRLSAPARALSALEATYVFETALPLLRRGLRLEPRRARVALLGDARREQEGDEEAHGRIQGRARK